jgi:hypothetical protein
MAKPVGIAASMGQLGYRWRSIRKHIEMDETTFIRFAFNAYPLAPGDARQLIGYEL